MIQFKHLLLSSRSVHQLSIKPEYVLDPDTNNGFKGNLCRSEAAQISIARELRGKAIPRQSLTAHGNCGEGSVSAFRVLRDICREVSIR